MTVGLYGPEAVLGATGTPATDTPVNVYLTGTVTPADLFTDSTGGTSASNPTTTDTLGNLAFYAAAGLYDLAFTVGGVATTITVQVQPWWQDAIVSDDFVEANATGLSNILVGDIPLFGVGSALIGSPPGAGVPHFLFQSATFTGTTNGFGILTVPFPETFPNGVLAVVPVLGDGDATAKITLDNSLTTTSGFDVILSSSDSPVPTTGTRVNYIAIGW